LYDVDYETEGQKINQTRDSHRHEDADVVFWVFTLCGLADRYQSFGGIYHIYVQDENVSDECWESPTRLCDVTAQRTMSETFTAMRTSNL
jgi:hypothetical protein